MFQHRQRKFELYWYTARDLSIDEKTIVYQFRHKDKMKIMFNYVGDGFQADDFCDIGYT